VNEFGTGEELRKSTQRLKLITYNIQFGRGLDGVYDLDRIAHAVEDADVIALQEVERNFPRSGYIDQPGELAKRLKFHHWVYGAGVDISADEVLPAGEVVHKRQQFGNMLLSRTPITTSRNHLLPKCASVGPLSIQRSALEGVIDWAGQRIRIYSIHLSHLSAEERLPQIARLLQIDRNAPREGGPISGNPAHTDFAKQADVATLPRYAIMMGDFNFTPDSDEYACVVGPKCDYGGRVVNPEGFVDAWQAKGNPEMAGVTAKRLGEDVRMDYCFVPHALSHRIDTVTILSDETGSDHKPVSVILRF